MPIVVIERGNDKGKSVALEAGRRYVFGRDPGATVPLADPLTSRRHFEISGEGAVFRLKDLSSTNGTFLNDSKVDLSDLKVGDKIQAGETILSFLSDQREETAQGLVGKTIGGYKILERVGRGGMGTVYKANQLSLNRLVALKVLSAKLLKDSKFIDKFKSEARAAGQLNHPNIVQVYDVGTDRDLHFFSMEFMDGGSVQDLVGKDDKLAWEEALDVFMQAGRALIFAEKKGIVHRDVKPDNLMLTSDGQTKLADLGLAKTMEDGDGPAEEGIFGTPHFISPEQAQGREVDHRADLYSLGASAYRILSGRTPFSGSNVGEIIQQQIHAEPPSLKQFCPDAPDELIAVVAKLMKKKPEDRYASAEQLLADLEAIRLRYHLKVHGGRGGKGVFIAAAAAVVAVAAVAVFALSKRGDDNGDTPAPIIVTNTQDAPRIIKVEDEESKRALRESQAENDRLRIAQPSTDLEGTAYEKREEWRAAAAKFEAMAAAHEGTRAADAAEQRAMAIRTAVDAAEAAWTAAQTAAENQWKELKRRVNDALAEGRFADALLLVEEESARPELATVLARVQGAAEEIDRWTSEERLSIRDRFSTAWRTARDEFEALRAEGDHSAAAEKLRTFLGAAAGSVDRDPFAAARAEAGVLFEALRTELTEKLRADLAADRTLYYETWRSVRHIADVPGESWSDNPVFEYRFEVAAARFDALLDPSNGAAVLRTAPYRQRATAAAARLRRVERFFGDFVRRFAERRIASDEIALATSQGAQSVTQIRLDPDSATPADRDGVTVTMRYAGATAKRVLAWADYAPKELWDKILLGGKRFEMTPEEAAGAALFLAATGVSSGLAEMIAAAGDALEPEDRAWLAGEQAALRAYDDLLLAVQTRPAVEHAPMIQRLVENHSTSDVFLLIYGFEEPYRLLPAERIEAYVREGVDKLGAPPK